MTPPDDRHEIAALRALIAASPRPANLAERRARMESITAIDPIPLDIAMAPLQIGAMAAEWSLAPGSDARKALLFFHGGGYLSGSLKSHRTMVTGAGRAAGIRTLAIDYRRAPEHPFPAALEDARAAWDFLATQGYGPGDILVGGDSAGGGLTLALCLALKAERLPLPAGLWLVSPWTDLKITGASIAEKDADDPLIHRGYLQELAEAYLAGRTPADDPLVSPLYGDLAGLPPALIQVGTAETLLDDAVRLARRLALADGRATLSVWPRMIHAWPIWHARLAAGRAALAEMGAFARAQLG
ncbi:alpha/beta hydrolase [Xanthobacter tagetidis]|uniref:Alpha/beta hydrolase n=1 Tax=Xanthobacter tagetidis TaxID=60216 RepID=A0A3L7AEV7_9HYPH|nr:alpha/beta hydrolase [Xanthobacter tagetidis]MBB6306004.1 acetyl esterase/lipase [Xanthobacter tagetidis]RLP78514.1 alpha/beta hydrolase [Xanthobacter tagetidis]